MDMFDLRQAIERGYQFPVIARLLLRAEIEVQNKAAELRLRLPRLVRAKSVSRLFIEQHVGRIAEHDPKKGSQQPFWSDAGEPRTNQDAGDRPAEQREQKPDIHMAKAEMTDQRRSSTTSNWSPKESTAPGTSVGVQPSLRVR